MSREEIDDHLGAADDDPIPRFWKRRELLEPLLATYGARVLGEAIARRFGLETSRTACAKLAALMMALTGFEHFFDSLDFYASWAEEDPQVAECFRDLQAIDL